jgi:hypothetical protein
LTFPPLQPSRNPFTTAKAACRAVRQAAFACAEKQRIAVKRTGMQTRCTKICQKVWQGALKTKKHPLKRFRQRSFADDTLKNICRDSRERLTYIVFDIRAILEGYYQIYEDCVNIGPRNGRDGAEWGSGHGR